MDYLRGKKVVLSLKKLGIFGEVFCVYFVLIFSQGVSPKGKKLCS